MEFYRKFWPLISEPFIQCANECFKKVKCLPLKNKQSLRLLEFSDLVENSLKWNTFFHLLKMSLKSLSLPIVA